MNRSDRDADGPCDVLPSPPDADAFRLRQSRLRELLAQHAMGGAVVTPGPAFAYLTGRELGRSERLTALLMRSDGATALIAARFEAEGMEPLPGETDRIEWDEHEDPFPHAARWLGNGVAQAKAAVEPTTFCRVVQRLEDAGIACDVREGGALFEQVRILKDAGEIDCIRAAVRATTEVLDAARRRVASDMTDTDIDRLVGSVYADRGLRGGALVQIDETSSLPHGRPAGRRLRPGSVLLLDSGCAVHGYRSDITRTFQFGTLSDRFREIHGIVLAAQGAAIAAVRPGMPCEEIDRAARSVIEGAGYGPCFTHRVGHGIGLEGHEPPYLVRGNRAPLEPGTVVTIEPGIYLPAAFGVRIEDVVLVTNDGAEPLSTPPDRPMTAGA